MNRSAMLSLLAVSLTLLGACAKEPPKKAPPPPPPAEDTTPVVPTAPAPAPVSRMGSLPLMRELPPPPEGQCDMSQRARQRIIFTGDVPVRTVMIELGDSSRAFRPRIIEVKASQNFMGTDETETAYAWFSADGNVETATRNYSATGAKPANESRRLTPDEIGPMKALAEAVLNRCK